MDFKFYDNQSNAVFLLHNSKFKDFKAMPLPATEEP